MHCWSLFTDTFSNLRTRTMESWCSGRASTAKKYCFIFRTFCIVETKTAYFRQKKATHTHTVSFRFVIYSLRLERVDPATTFPAEMHDPFIHCLDQLILAGSLVTVFSDY
ncbi:hypothetical protein GOODEAATRI_001372 [Goodea atripinnis]|uniref:Uncharacterized protein n=1 Tax=Goodea atripinnis TaxID=208336 RepID=A0ABV0MXU1_9TELE